MASAGGIGKRPSLFSADGLLILAPAGPEVRIFSSLTGECTGALEGHSAEVTALSLDPKNEAQVYSASKDGTIKLWNYQEQTCLQTLIIRETVRSMVLNKELGVAFMSIDWKGGTSGRVITYDLVKGKPGKAALRTRMPKALVSAGPHSTFIATFDKHSLFVWRAAPEIYQPLNLHHTKPYTCAAINAEETIIAAGDATGRVLIWRNFAEHVPTERKEGAHSGKHHPSVPLPVTTYHWHPSAVGCMTFSRDSSILLTGGNEGVLVMWMLENGNRNFLPRLGRPLLGLSNSPSDPAKYLMRQAGNTIRVVNTATMKVETSIHGLRPCPSSLQPSEASTATLLHPGTGFLVSPCDEAQLQVYDTLLHRHVALIQVSPRNPISPPLRPDEWGPYGPPIEPHVSQAVFSPWDASVMATVDVRPDGGPYASSECCLKFWDSGTTEQALPGALTASVGTGTLPAMILNTRVDEPHQGGVTSLTYHPTQHLVVTTGVDSEFKIWTRTRVVARPGGGGSAKSWCWRCRSTGSYKNLPLSASAFSDDGSLLAIAALSRATLWDPETNALSTVLVPPPQHQEASIRKLEFVRNSPYLVGASGGCLMVWNLLTANLHWSLDIKLCHLASDPLYSRFAITVPYMQVEQPSVTQHRRASDTGSTGDLQITNRRMSGAGDGAREEGVRGTNYGGPGTVRDDQHNLDAAVSPSEDGVPSSSPAAPASVRTNSQGSADGGRFAGPSCHIFVFDPASRDPLYHCHVPRSLSASVHFVGAHLPQHGQVATGMPKGISPFLILGNDRSYSYSLAPGKRQAPGYAAQKPDQPATAPVPVSTFSAAFGSLSVSKSQVAGAEVEDKAAVAASKKDAVRQLFDAPSHALPTPANLANAFLHLLTTSQQPRD